MSTRITPGCDGMNGGGENRATLEDTEDCSHKEQPIKPGKGSTKTLPAKEGKERTCKTQIRAERGRDTNVLRERLAGCTCRAKKRENPAGAHTKLIMSAKDARRVAARE